MSRLIWVAAWIGVVFWALVSLAAYGTIDFASQALVGGADLAPRPPDSFRTGDPHPLELLFPLLSAFRSLGLGAVVIVWLLGSTAILGLAWASTRFLRLVFGESHRPIERTRPSHLPRWPAAR